MKDPIREEFERLVEAQRQKNKVKWGYQDMTRLLLVSQEQLGQMASEFISNGAGEKFKIEVVHLAAVLPEIYTEAIKLEADQRR